MRTPIVVALVSSGCRPAAREGTDLPTPFETFASAGDALVDLESEVGRIDSARERARLSADRARFVATRARNARRALRPRGRAPLNAAKAAADASVARKVTERVS